VLALLESRSQAGVTLSRPTPDKLLRLPDVLRLTGLRRSSVYEKMKAGTFPRSVKVGARAVTWSEAAIQAWIRERLSVEPRIGGR
jgi:prophage regulatory protein